MLKHDCIDSRHLWPKDLDRNENLKSKNGDGDPVAVYETIIVDTAFVVNAKDDWIVGSHDCHVEDENVCAFNLDIVDLESVSSLPGVVLHGLPFVIL